MAQQPDSPVPSVPAAPSGARNGGEGAAPVAPATPTQTEVFFASIFPGPDRPLPESCNAFAKAVIDYERSVVCPVWVLIQNESTPTEAMATLTEALASSLITARDQFESDKKMHLILHTLGGDPHAGYKIAVFLQKTTSGFEVVIPKQAKSAGTLMALGATKITMGYMAELGPLDMQVKDLETDLWDSALNETKSLQTLSREALLLYVEKMEVLNSLYRRKAFETKSKIATEFVNEMIRPLVEKLQVVHYTRMARIMDIMKKYGRQLMKRAGYSPKSVEAVIESLGEEYPDHGYIIDVREARDLGLRAESPKTEVASFIEQMEKVCGCQTIVGKLTSSTPAA